MADTEATKKFPELKKIIIEVGYLYKQVSNCKETAIYWKKNCQEKSLISIEERQAKGCKELKANPVLSLKPLVRLSLHSFAQSCPTLCNPIDCSLPGSFVHGIFQAVVLEWIAISFSRGSSQPRAQTQVSHIVDRCFTV